MIDPEKWNILYSWALYLSNFAWIIRYRYSVWVFHDLIRGYHHEMHESFIATLLSIQESGCKTNNWNQFSPFLFIDKYREFVFRPKTHFDINYYLMIIAKKNSFYSTKSYKHSIYFIIWQITDAKGLWKSVTFTVDTTNILHTVRISWTIFEAIIYAA